MKSRSLLIFFSIIITLLLVGCGENNQGQLSQNEKLEDFNYMYEVIKEGYPFLEVNKRVHNVDWLANKKEYIQQIKSTKDDESFIAALGDILMDLNNSHTRLLSKGRDFQFFKGVYEEFKWYDFYDDEVVLKRYQQDQEEAPSPSSEENNSTKEGKELRLMDAVEGKVGYMYLPQMERPGVPLEDDMETIENYLKKLDNYQALIIDVRGNGGGNDLYWMYIVSMLIDKDMNREGYILFRDGVVINNYVMKRKIARKNISNFVSLELENIPDEAVTDFKSYTEASAPIKANKVTSFNGNIYLLVDEAVYSSSETFAIFAQDTGFATLIGSKTSGDGGGIDPVLFNLPNSGLVVRMSSVMFLTSTGLCNEEHKTTPDYIIEDTSINAYEGKFTDDNCVQKVLEIENIR